MTSFEAVLRAGLEPAGKKPAPLSKAKAPSSDAVMEFLASFGWCVASILAFVFFLFGMRG